MLDNINKIKEELQSRLANKAFEMYCNFGYIPSNESIDKAAELLFNTIIDDIENSLNDIELLTFQGIKKVNIINISDNLLIKALKHKIDSNDTKSIYDILKENDFGAVVFDANTSRFIFENIPRDISEFLFDNNCKLNDFRLIDEYPYKYVISDMPETFNMYDIYYEYFKKIKNFSIKGPLLGIESLEKHIYNNHSIKINFVNKSGANDYVTITSENDLTSALDLIEQSLLGSGYRGILSNLLYKGYTLDEIRRLTDKYDLFTLKRIDGIHIDRLCTKHEISYINIIVKLLNNISIDKAVEECIEYKREHYDYCYTTKSNSNILKNSLKNRKNLAIKVIRDITSKKNKNSIGD